MNKEKALEILHTNMNNQNLRRHCYAVSYAMGGIYDYLNENNMLREGAKRVSPDSYYAKASKDKSEDSQITSSQDREIWEVLGLLHDADYEITKDDWSKHTLLTLEWLEKEGVPKNSPLHLAIQSHNNKVTKLREPQTQMEWALECCDELTGFIVACALVKDKKLSNVTLDTVKKNWKKKGFAAGVEREQIEQCEEKLNIKLDEFIEVVLKAMQDNSNDLGL